MNRRANARQGWVLSEGGAECYKHIANKVSPYGVWGILLDDVVTLCSVDG
jgi:hypothetical protein